MAMSKQLSGIKSNCTIAVRCHQHIAALRFRLMKTIPYDQTSLKTRLDDSREDVKQSEVEQERQ